MTKVVQSLAGIATNKLKIFNFSENQKQIKNLQKQIKKKETNQQTENL